MHCVPVFCWAQSFIDLLNEDLNRLTRGAKWIYLWVFVLLSLSADKASSPWNVSLRMAKEDGRRGLRLSWKTPAHVDQSVIIRYKARISCAWRAIRRKVQRKTYCSVNVSADSVFLDGSKLRKCPPTPLCRKVECIFISVTAQLRAISACGPGNYSQATTWIMGES